MNFGEIYIPYNVQTEIEFQVYYLDPFGNVLYINTCYVNVIVANYVGLAVAGLTLKHGYCNTTSPPNAALAYVQAANSDEEWGPLQTVTVFHQEIDSYLSGSIFFGSYGLCQEIPLGQTDNFGCIVFTASPLFSNNTHVLKTYAQE